MTPIYISSYIYIYINRSHLSLFYIKTNRQVQTVTTYFPYLGMNFLIDPSKTNTCDAESNILLLKLCLKTRFLNCHQSTIAVFIILSSITFGMICFIS